MGRIDLVAIVVVAVVIVTVVIVAIAVVVIVAVVSVFPPNGECHRRPDPHTFVSFDTWALGFHSLRVFLVESDGDRPTSLARGEAADGLLSSW